MRGNNKWLLSNQSRTVLLIFNSTSKYFKIIDIYKFLQLFVSMSMAHSFERINTHCQQCFSKANKQLKTLKHHCLIDNGAFIMCLLCRNSKTVK